ncbi:hypothetical protein DENSPDRAFT_879020 [Dentipellis sp. KUC8613]|nr:hypothetical protein DENSPDRAFT_879020 [Dentipellis sp. KUC8613]
MVSLLEDFDADDGSSDSDIAEYSVAEGMIFTPHPPGDDFSDYEDDNAMAPPAPPVADTVIHQASRDQAPYVACTEQTHGETLQEKLSSIGQDHDACKLLGILETLLQQVSSLESCIDGMRIQARELEASHDREFKRAEGLEANIVSLHREGGGLVRTKDDMEEALELNKGEDEYGNVLARSAGFGGKCFVDHEFTLPESCGSTSTSGLLGATERNLSLVLEASIRETPIWSAISFGDLLCSPGPASDSSNSGPREESSSVLTLDHSRDSPSSVAISVSSPESARAPKLVVITAGPADDSSGIASFNPLLTPSPVRPPGGKNEGAAFGFPSWASFASDISTSEFTSSPMGESSPMISSPVVDDLVDLHALPSPTTDTSFSPSPLAPRPSPPGQSLSIQLALDNRPFRL